MYILVEKKVPRQLVSESAAKVEFMASSMGMCNVALIW